MNGESQTEMGRGFRGSDRLAAAALLTDYSKLPREERNILRLVFDRSRRRVRREDWSSVARFVVGAFRADVARAGAGASNEVFRLVDELCRRSPEFDALWQDNEVVAHGEGIKCIHHPEAGLLDLEFSSFAVEGRPDLSTIAYNPASPLVAERVRTIILAMRE